MTSRRPHHTKHAKFTSSAERVQLTLGGSLVEREGGIEPVRRQARPEGAVHFPEGRLVPCGVVGLRWVGQSSARYGARESNATRHNITLV